MHIYFIKLDDVGVTQNFQYTDFSSDSLDIGLLHDFIFLQGFNGDFFIRKDMGC